MRRREYERLERLHREMWSWCAETGQYKYDWPGWGRFKRHIGNKCFACEVREGSYDCGLCPIKWVEKGSGINYSCEFADSPYMKWTIAQANSNIKLSKEFAAKIAEMIWRPYEPKRKLL